jgi:hypothetical protein
MQVLFWPRALTRRVLRPARSSGALFWTRASLVPVSVTVGALFAAVSLTADFYAARIEVLMFAGHAPGSLERALLVVREGRMLGLWDGAAFPLLAAALGYALSAASHSAYGSAEDRLTRLYRSLSDAADRSGAPDEVTQWLARVNAHFVGLDSARAALADSMRSAWQAARALEIERNAPDADRRFALAAQIDRAFGFRRLSAVLESPAESYPDGTGHVIRFEFLGGTHENEPAGNDQPLALQFLLFGDGLSVARPVVDIVLPARGASEPVRVPVHFTTRHARLRVVVTERDRADVLQEFDIAATAPE